MGWEAARTLPPNLDGLRSPGADRLHRADQVDMPPDQPIWRCMQDGQLDAFGRVNREPERETEPPRNVLGGLLGRHEHRSTEGELLATEADTPP
jgi:hypothetical protein